MVHEAQEQVLTVVTRRAAVLGSPISHSLSPALHQAAYRALELSHWSYGAHETPAPALRGFVAGLDLSWAGLSLTMPLKEVAFEVAHEVSDLARDVGAINTLVRAPGGRWRGENTDVHGVSQALREAGFSSVPSAVVLGSGATARSVVAALATLGCTKVTFAVRSTARQETLEQARRAGLEVAVAGLGDLAECLGEARVVVSTLPPTALPPTVPQGISKSGISRSGAPIPGTPMPGVPLPGVELSALSAGLLAGGPRLAGHLFLDVVYADWPTSLAQIFEGSGATVVSGLEMLVHQAAEQVHLMTGLRPPVEPMRAAGLAAMGSR